MPETNWRNEWPPFRVDLVDETARCLANRKSSATDGRLPGWDELAEEQQNEILVIIAGVFLASDEAMRNLLGTDGEPNEDGI